MKQGEAVVVTTDYGGVFFGYLQSIDDNRTAVLTKARNCIKWSTDVRGFVGLASSGPIGCSKVGPSVEEITIFCVTAILAASERAIKEWEKEPWK